MRVLVCGGRQFDDRHRLFDVLDEIHTTEGPITCIIHGDAAGADTFGKWWALATGIPHLPFKADWLRHTKAAGPIRNARMLKEGKPDLVVAFLGGNGTADMINRAERAGVPVRKPQR